MSTASRYRETACGSRAICRNAAGVPGLTGATRGYYGPRAARQLGGLNKTEPKCAPAVVSAAPSGRAFAPILLHHQREPRLRHSPPPLSPPIHPPDGVFR